MSVRDCFPVIGGGKFGYYRKPLNTPFTKEGAEKFKFSGFYLEEEADGLFRLHCKGGDDFRNEAGHFSITCPYCNAKLKLVAPASDMHILALFECKTCHKYGNSGGQNND